MIDDPERPQRSADHDPSAEPPPSQPSARRIWLAGLGALARAQAEGGKMFETLAQEGQKLQQRTTERMSGARGRVSAAAADLSERASGTLGRAEERLARRLADMGLADRDDVDALRRRVEALETDMDELLDVVARLEREAPTPPSARTGGAREVRSEPEDRPESGET